MKLIPTYLSVHMNDSCFQNTVIIRNQGQNENLV